MFSLNGTLKKSGSVGRWETKQFIEMALVFRSGQVTESHRCKNDSLLFYLATVLLLWSPDV